MKRDYLTEKELKKRSTKQGLVFLFIFIAIFIAVIFRLAVRPGSSFSGLPGGGDAYHVAKDLIKTAAKAPLAEFPDRDFEYVKTGDSIYTIKSYFETDGANGRMAKTNFTATLKYKGGSWLNDSSWTMVSLREQP